MATIKFQGIEKISKQEGDKVIVINGCPGNGETIYFKNANGHGWGEAIQKGHPYSLEGYSFIHFESRLECTLQYDLYR